MGSFLTELHPGWIAAVLGLGMLLAWNIAWRTGKADPNGKAAAADLKCSDAIVTLLGLLLAFTFSMALVKHEQRRQMVITDSNAIGDFSNCLGMLKEPMRGQLQAAVYEYVQSRLRLAVAPLAESAFPQFIQHSRLQQEKMHDLLMKGLEAGTPGVVPLMNTFNALSSSHTARLAAVRDRLPSSIVILLFTVALLAMTLLGRQQRAAGEWRPASTFCLVLVVSLIIWVILDLNQPQQGWITVSQEPMQWLLDSLPKS